MNPIDVWGSFLNYFAVTFGGKRNLPVVLGYKPTLTYFDYLARYARGDIAGRIVEIPAQATWEALPQFSDGAGVFETALSRKFERLAQRIQLRLMLEKVDILAGIGRYAVLLIGFRDGGDLSKPVKPGSMGPDDVLFLAPFSEANAIPTDIDMDPSSPGFGSPSHYSIDFARGVAQTDPALYSVINRLSQTFGSGSLNQKVHVSRLIHVAEGTLEDQLFGRPRLRRVWDRMDDLAKVVGGSAEVFWLVANRGLQFDVDKELQLNDEDKTELQNQFDEYEHGQRRMFRTRGVRIQGLNELGSGNVNPRPVFGVIAALICGSTDIPYRMLFGTERGQNTNAQDRATWLEVVAARREGFATEVMLRPLIQRLVNAGALPAAAQDADLVWPPVHDDKHQAEVAQAVAAAEYSHARAKNLGSSTIADREFRTLFLGLPPDKPAEPAPVVTAPVLPAPANTTQNGTGVTDPQGMNGSA
jgi:hypothetical protein